MLEPAINDINAVRNMTSVSRLVEALTIKDICCGFGISQVADRIFG